mmetsp:Transcript_18226/g.42436  ORF Transcript_18226/g.42436 Transcript_18226/m.42436 type:complete len:220 (+) Transcript_18226:404-1063(+)
MEKYTRWLCHLPGDDPRVSFVCLRCRCHTYLWSLERSSSWILCSRLWGSCWHRLRRSRLYRSRHCSTVRIPWASVHECSCAVGGLHTDRSWDAWLGQVHQACASSGPAWLRERSSSGGLQGTAPPLQGCRNRSLARGLTWICHVGTNCLVHAPCEADSKVHDSSPCIIACYRDRHRSGASVWSASPDAYRHCRGIHVHRRLTNAAILRNPFYSMVGCSA